MFEARTRRLTLLAAAVAGLFAVVPGWIHAGSAPAEPPTPLLHAPPLFATAGEGRDVTAVVPGDPEAVTLAVSAGSGTLRYPMRRVEGATFVGSIPANALARETGYTVEATYGGVTSAGPNGRLITLDRVASAVASRVDASGQHVLDIELGDGDDAFGVRGGNESAAELPPSFAVDADGKRVHVLDAVKQRIVTFDAGGKRLGTTALKTKTASDITIDPATNDTFVLDQAADTLTRISKGRQQTWSAIGARAMPFGARLAYDARGDSAFVRDAAQGRHVPVVARGQRTTGAERSSEARNGAPSPRGDLSVEVAERSVTFGLIGDDARGFRVDFADEVLDAPEAVVDGDGFVWALVGTYDRTADAASVSLVRVDPADGSARATNVDPSVPGDVTRRLVATGSGVVLLEGEGRALRLVSFERI